MIPGTYSTPPTVSAIHLTIDGTGSSLNIAVADGSVEVTQGASLTLIGLAITSGNGDGIRCEGSDYQNSLTVHGVTIDANGSALLANPCAVTGDTSSFRTRNANLPVILATPPVTMALSRSIFRGGDGVQALGGGSFVKIDDSLFLDQLGTEGAVLGGQFGGSGFGTLTVSFSTFVNSKIGCGTGTPACAGGNVAGVCIDNSIIVGATGGDAVAGTACDINYSVVMPQAGAVSGSNNKLNVDPMFQDQAGGNYTLKSTSAAIDAADPNAIVPSLDLAGTPRPQGARADMGAYEYKP